LIEKRTINKVLANATASVTIFSKYTSRFFEMILTNNRDCNIEMVRYLIMDSQQSGHRIIFGIRANC
jgi:hypothetical protein